MNKKVTTVAPSDIIQRIRASFIGAEQVYTQGSCAAFFLILSELYPQAIAHWSDEMKHMITEIDGKFYDIRGEIPKSVVESGKYKRDSDTWKSMSIAVAIPQESTATHSFPTLLKMNP